MRANSPSWAGTSLFLPSAAHAYAPLLSALRLQQGVPPLLHSNVPAPLAQISALPLQRGGPHLQTSAVNPPPTISAFLLQQYVLPLQSSAVRAVPHPPPPPPPPPLSVSIQGRGEQPPPHSAVHAHAPLLSVLIPQIVEPPPQLSAVNPLPLPQILSSPLLFNETCLLFSLYQRTLLLQHSPSCFKGEEKTLLYLQP